jgi:YD repeat-containing protein
LSKKNLAAPAFGGMLLNHEGRLKAATQAQALIEDGPRTDVADITAYTYYADTADHALGDLQSISNAAGQVTQFTKYNVHGPADARGVTTTHSYDLRMRRASTSVGERTTSYSYEPTGDVKRVTQPDGSWIEYSYDDARRLTAVADQAGNRIEYTLDNAGNRLQENIKDPGGALQRSITRSFDPLGRLKKQRTPVTRGHRRHSITNVPALGGRVVQPASLVSLVALDQVPQSAGYEICATLSQCRNDLAR